MCRALVLVLLIGSSGCGRSPEVIVDPTTDRLGKILQMYSQATREAEKPPRSIADLKAIAKKREYGDEVFKSENDGEPFVIVWGIDIRNPHPTPPVIAHEKVGRAGKKWVVDTMTPRLLSDDELSKAKSGS